jgi:DNA helicase-2/ATP-dependent DNA helicase PcrA
MSDGEDLGLHAAQRCAAEAEDPVIAVLAGPGSGKTRTLSARARFLLLQCPGSQALLLTFMNKAAAEMKSRSLLGAPFAPSRIWAGTFHAFCAQLLRDHHELADLTSDFAVLDAEDALEMAAAAGGGPDDLWRYDRIRAMRQPVPKALQAFAAAYENAKSDEGAVDFTDLLVRGAQLLEDHTDLAAAYGRRYPHLLVDEFQDTDASRFAVVRALASHVETISVFADDDQAIMSFAGADRGNVAQFVADLDARLIPLTVNYRSREVIVAAANRLVIADQFSSGRTMEAVRDGGDVVIRAYASQAAEAASITQAVSDRLEDREPEEIAILTRTTNRANAVADALIKAGIPVTDWRVDIVDGRARRAVAACLATLRPRLASRHESMLYDLAGLERSRRQETGAVLQALSSGPVGTELIRVREAALGGADVVPIINAITSLVAEQRSELSADVAHIREAVAAFAAHDEGFSIEHLLTELALGSGGRAPTEGGGVKLATMHRTKGLQWPVVFMIGMEEGCLPDFRQTTAPAISEERRLCFVGVSRAEDELILSYARQVNGWAKAPSRFLAELQGEM